MIKQLIAKLLIPKNTPYCYIPKKPIKPSKKYPYGGYKVKRCPFWCWKFDKETDCKQQYCKYIKDFLSIQDAVKDCGVNDDYEC
ncbi:MAG: hypothetical protein V8Q75_03375 [Bacilli bacterium]